MDNPIKTLSPCPKCGGERIDAFGKDVGLDPEYSEKSDALVCLCCGYIELYALPETIAQIKQKGSAAARKEAGNRAWAERMAELERERAKPLWKRFFGSH